MVVEPTHLKNMLVKLDHFHKDRGKIKKSFKPPPTTLPIWTLPFPFCLTWKFLHLVLSSGGEPVRGGEVPFRGGERGEVPCRSAIGWWLFFPKLPNQKMSPLSWVGISIYALWAVYITHVINWYLLVILVSTKGGPYWLSWSCGQIGWLLDWRISGKNLADLDWLVVSTPLKNISQNGNLPQAGAKIKSIWNHQLVDVSRIS